MGLAKTLIASVVLLTIAVSVSAQKSHSKKVRITSKDKAQILEQVFGDGFEKLIKDERFHPCSIPIVDDEQIILVETDEPSIFPKVIGEYRFKFLNGKKIEGEIKSNNGDCYFKVGGFRFGSPVKATITLWRWIEVITVLNGKSWYPSRWVGATGRVYEAKKEKGKWRVKFSKGTSIVS